MSRRIDPCALLDRDTLSSVHADQPALVHVERWRRGRLDLAALRGRPGDGDRYGQGAAGRCRRAAFQQSDTTSGAKCDVSWAHLPRLGDFAEVASVTFVRYAAQPGEDPCAKAAAVARALVPELPRK